MRPPRNQSTLVIGLLILGFGSVAQGADRTIRANWAQLGAQVIGRKISTVLTDSTLVEGKVVSVEPGALVMTVSKTSAPARFAKTASVPRALVSTLRVSRPGWKWRVIGPVAGFLSGAVAGGLIGDKINPEGFIISDGAATGATVGGIVGAVAGYIIGHFADRHTTVIFVVN